MLLTLHTPLCVSVPTCAHCPVGTGTAELLYIRWRLQDLLFWGETSLNVAGERGDSLSRWRCGQADVHPITRGARSLLPLELATKLLLTWET